VRIDDKGQSHKGSFECVHDCQLEGHEDDTVVLHEEQRNDAKKLPDLTMNRACAGHEKETERSILETCNTSDTGMSMLGFLFKISVWLSANILASSEKLGK